MFRATSAHHQEGQLYQYIIWYNTLWWVTDVAVKTKLVSSACFEQQVLIIRRISLYQYVTCYDTRWWVTDVPVKRKLKRNKYVEKQCVNLVITSRCTVNKIQNKYL
jgi:hypothetical protein